MRLDELVAYAVQLLGGDAGADMLGDHVENRRGKVPGGTHAGKSVFIVKNHSFRTHVSPLRFRPVTDLPLISNTRLAKLFSGNAIHVAVVHS